jgi:hypothetical protein
MSADAHPGVSKVGVGHVGDDVLLRSCTGWTYDDGHGRFAIELDDFFGTPKAGDFIL